MIHFSDLSAFCQAARLPLPEHPLLSIISMNSPDMISCFGSSGEPLSNDFYSISLKRIISGKIAYGRTSYDFSNGVFMCMAPRRTLQWEGIVTEANAKMLTFHEDFVKGTSLEKTIDKYGFFSYSAHEALHLSPKEEKTMESIFDNIATEYHNNQDEFSKSIIIAQIDSLLKYADRFYKRQFLTRAETTVSHAKAFNEALDDYYEINLQQEVGIPSIDTIADKLKLSARYLSDLLKLETGKTAIEHIHYYVINKAKEHLLSSNDSVSETAYKLGFEYPQYFSRLFKKKVGISPTEFRTQYRLN